VSDAAAVISALPPEAAKMVAVEILLADPEALGDDVLESCLYILREKLRSACPSTAGRAAISRLPDMSDIAPRRLSKKRSRFWWDQRSVRLVFPTPGIPTTAASIGSSDIARSSACSPAFLLTKTGERFPAGEARLAEVLPPLQLP
jgi:hypothetical protein